MESGPGNYNSTVISRSILLIAIIAMICFAFGCSIKNASGNEADKLSGPGWHTVKMRVTAYCPCPKCCGKYSDGVTANGHVISQGDRFVAADRRFAFDTEMVIPGYNNSKTVKVYDRGGAIKGNRLDVFFNTHAEALQWGIQYLDVKIHSK